MIKSTINNNIYKGEYVIEIMDKSKHFILPLFIVLSIIAISMFASAATTLTKPIIDNNYTSPLIVNCTSAITNIHNATWYYNETGGRAVTSLTSLANTSAGQLSFQKSIAITSLTDAATYNVTCKVINETADEEFADGVTPITFDSTKPTCTATVSKGFIEIYNEQNTLACTCTDSIDSSLTVTRTLTKPSGSVTISAASYPTVPSDVDQVGGYTYACYTTDDAGNLATTSSKTFTAETSEEADSLAGQTKAIIANGNNTMLYAAVGAVVVVLLVVFLLNKK